MESLEDELESCKLIKDKKERSACVWGVIYKTERFIDEARKHLPLLSDEEAIASTIVMRNVDISREIAKGFKFKEPHLIDFGYIMEKYEHMKTDLDLLKRELRKKRLEILGI